MTGTTKSGFNYEIDTELLKKWTFMRLSRKADEDATKLVDLLEYVLGADQTEALADHCEDDTEKMIENFTEIVLAVAEVDSAVKK